MKKKLTDAAFATALGLGVVLVLYLVLHLARQRTPIEAQMVTAQGAAADVAAMINSEAFQARAVKILTTAEGMTPAAVADELKFLRAGAKRGDLVEIKALARDEYAGKRLVDVISQQVLQDPVRFRLGDLGKRYAVFSAVRDHSAACARASAAAEGAVATPQVMQIKLESMFLAASLLRELELQGAPDNFLKHLEAMKAMGLQRLQLDPATRSYGDIDVLYRHALCQSTQALATAQFAIADNLVKTEYRLLYAASAPPEAASRGEVKNLMLVIPAGLIAAWLALYWRARARRQA